MSSSLFLMNYLGPLSKRSQLSTVVMRRGLPGRSSKTFCIPDVQIYIYICMYVCMYACMYVCIYVCNVCNVCIFWNRMSFVPMFCTAMQCKVFSWHVMHREQYAGNLERTALHFFTSTTPNPSEECIFGVPNKFCSMDGCTKLPGSKTGLLV